MTSTCALQPAAPRVGTWSEQGTRPRNEDYLTVALPRPDTDGTLVFALADGMGGRPLGDALARTACAAARHALATDRACRVRGAFDQANEAVVLVADLADCRGAGATLCLGALTGGHLELCHEGDTLCYLVRGGTRELLTEPDRTDQGALTHYLGQWHGLAPHYREVDLKPGDTLVACTDGVWEGLDEQGFLAALAAHPDDPVAAARQLCERGGAATGDNASAIVIQG